MTWFAIHDQNGKLVSITEVVADNLPVGLTIKQLAGSVTPDQMWDEATRAFIARPPKVLIDRLDDLRAMPGVQAFWNSLTANQKNTLGNALITILGKRRYRSASQPVAVDVED